MLQIPERKQLTVPKIESPEGYYEEAEPYDTSIIGMYVPGARALRVCYNLQLTHHRVTGRPTSGKVT